MKSPDFLAWLDRMGWSDIHAADQLGISRQTIWNYRTGYGTGKKEIPKYIALACEALERRAQDERKRLAKRTKHKGD